MYHQIVRRNVTRGFGYVSNGQYDKLVAECVPDVVHFFAGDHALGGERHDKAALLLWLERVGRLLPGFHLTITDMLVRGMPWDTTVVVQWTGRSTLVNKHEYVQHGVHFLRLRWGRVAAFRVYVDTQELAHELVCLGEFGVAEAMAAPIVS